MKGRILPLNKPLLYTYNDYAFISAIIGTDEAVMPWYFNNFINISYAIDWDTYFFENGELVFEHCPWIDMLVVNENMISNIFDSNIIHIIKEAINSGYYLRLFVDRFYIASTIEYQKTHTKHRICIYGYSEIDNMVYFCDNIDNGKFATEECSFLVLEKSFYSDAISISTDEQWHYKIMMYKHRKYSSIQLDLPYIKAQIENYLYSRHADDHIYHNHMKYGIDAIAHLIQQFADKSSRILDLRVFHLLCEQKMLMVGRLTYMQQNKLDITSDSVHKSYILQQDIIKIRNYAIKYNISRDPKLIDIIKNRLSENLAAERVLCQNLLSHLFT